MAKEYIGTESLRKVRALAIFPWFSRMIHHRDNGYLRTCGRETRKGLIEWCGNGRNAYHYDIRMEFTEIPLQLVRSGGRTRRQGGLISVLCQPICASKAGGDIFIDHRYLGSPASLTTPKAHWLRHRFLPLRIIRDPGMDH